MTVRELIAALQALGPQAIDLDVMVPDSEMMGSNWFDIDTVEQVAHEGHVFVELS